MPYTVGQLVYMREHREREEWDRLSFLVAHISALAGKKEVKMDDYHKFNMKKEILTREKFNNLKSMFPKNKGKNAIQPKD